MTTNGKPSPSIDVVRTVAGDSVTYEVLEETSLGLWRRRWRRVAPKGSSRGKLAEEQEGVAAGLLHAFWGKGEPA